MKEECTEIIYGLLAFPKSRMRGMDDHDEDSFYRTNQRAATAGAEDDSEVRCAGGSKAGV